DRAAPGRRVGLRRSALLPWRALDRGRAPDGPSAHGPPGVRVRGARARLLVLAARRPLLARSDPRSRLDCAGVGRRPDHPRNSHHSHLQGPRSGHRPSARRRVAARRLRRSAGDDAGARSRSSVARRPGMTGIALAAVSVPLLTFAVGALPGLLASIALVSYVLLYTPMKRQTAASLLVGALPGAIPPLIGWTAATERLDLPGILLFAVMFLWQVPHFLAITLFRKEDYARAGLVVQPNEPGGEREARANIVRYTVALVAVSLLFVPLGVGRGAYLAVALMVGAVFLGYAIAGLRQGAGRRWARNLFLLSLLYLPVLFGALVLDRHP